MLRIVKLASALVLAIAFWIAGLVADVSSQTHRAVLLVLLFDYQSILQQSTNIIYRVVGSAHV